MFFRRYASDQWLNGVDSAYLSYLLGSRAHRYTANLSVPDLTDR